MGWRTSPAALVSACRKIARTNGIEQRNVGWSVFRLTVCGRPQEAPGVLRPAANRETVYRRHLAPRDSSAQTCVINKLVACRSPLGRPLPPGERPGGTAPRQVRGALSLSALVFPAQPLGQLVEHGAH